MKSFPTSRLAKNPVMTLVIRYICLILSVLSLCILWQLPAELYNHNEGIVCWVAMVVLFLVYTGFKYDGIVIDEEERRVWRGREDSVRLSIDDIIFVRVSRNSDGRTSEMFIQSSDRQNIEIEDLPLHEEEKVIALLKEMNPSIDVVSD